MKRALFTVSYAGLWGQHTLDAPACVHKAAALGFDGVLFMGKAPHLFPLGLSDQEVVRVQEALSQTGLQAVGVAGYTDFLLRAAAEVPVLDMQVAYIEGCCQLARKLGGSVVRLFTGYLSEDASRSAAWNRMVQVLRRCGDIAQGEDVVLAVQNHHDMAVGTEELELLLEEVGHPAVRAGFDAWSPFLRGEDLAVVSRQMGPRTAMTIAANYKLYPRYTYHPGLVNYSREYPDMVRAALMSEGAIDYRAFLGGLQASGFDGWVVYEMCSPLKGGGSEANLDRHAADFITWMDGNFPR
jgi:sugar phosphate isomerase/epimerase